MKAKEVLKILNISRQTLTKYVKDKNVQVSKLSNGDYDYDKESVFKLLNNNTDRIIIVIENMSYSHDNKCIQTFVKDNIQEKIDIIKIKNVDELFDILRRVQNYEIKKIVVSQDDYDTICFLRKYKLILEQTGCEMVLMINQYDSQDDWNMYDLKMKVRQMYLRTNDEKIKNKLSLIDNILEI